MNPKKVLGRGLGALIPQRSEPSRAFVAGLAQIPIEQRSAEEVTHMTGRTADGRMETIDIAAPGSPAANYAFDVTPARLVTGLILERGVCAATEAGLERLYPERVERR